jgi:hypothetical protein
MLAAMSCSGRRSGPVEMRAFGCVRDRRRLVVPAERFLVVLSDDVERAGWRLHQRASSWNRWPPCRGRRAPRQRDDRGARRPVGLVLLAPRDVDEMAYRGRFTAAGMDERASWPP